MIYGDVKEHYEILNDESSWAEFRERYLSMEPEISLADNDICQTSANDLQSCI